MHFFEKGPLSLCNLSLSVLHERSWLLALAARSE
jgi:hypothetical protein